MKMFRFLGFLLTVALILGGVGACEKEEAAPYLPPPAAGITTDKASATGAEAREKPYIASVLRAPFHAPDCRWAAKISEYNAAGYDKRQDAIDDGHRPCKVCGP